MEEVLSFASSLLPIVAPELICTWYTRIVLRASFLLSLEVQPKCSRKSMRTLMLRSSLRECLLPSMSPIEHASWNLGHVFRCFEVTLAVVASAMERSYLTLFQLPLRMAAPLRALKSTCPLRAFRPHKSVIRRPSFRPYTNRTPPWLLNHARRLRCHDVSRRFRSDAGILSS